MPSSDIKISNLEMIMDENGLIVRSVGKLEDATIKEVKEEMKTYEDLVKTLPEIEIDGYKIEYGKTRVKSKMHPEWGSGFIVYDDESYLPLLVLFDNHNDLLSSKDMVSLHALTAIGWESSLLHRKMIIEYFGNRESYRWMNFDELEVIPTPDNPVELNFATIYVDALNYFIKDIKLTNSLYPHISFDVETDWNKLCDDITENKLKEKKEGNKMELLNIYTKESFKNIEKLYNVLIENERNNNTVRKEFNEVIKNFKNSLIDLSMKYPEDKSNENNGYITVMDWNEYDLGFCDVNVVDSSKVNNLVKTEWEEKKAINDKIAEVQAHLELIPQDDINTHDLVLEILKVYGIVDENGKVTPYVPTYLEEEEVKCPCVKQETISAEIKEKKHRGRPKKENK